MTNKLDCLKLINFIEKSNLFTTNKICGKKILIAFSGGQDSSCLLTIFYILSKKWGFKLGAVYCNHSWTHSFQSSLSAFENLQMFDIPFYFVESPNSEPMKPEQRARDWRYSSFYTISKWDDYDFVLTGHTLSDCVETVLFNLFRGSGLKGVCSLKENQKFYNLKLNDFFFKKNVWFSDSFLYFSEKKGNRFFQKYKLFKNLGFLPICPKLSFFVFCENCPSAKTTFLLINNSKDKFFELLTSFGIKNLFPSNKMYQVWFFAKLGQTSIKNMRSANSVRSLAFNNGLKKPLSRIAALHLIQSSLDFHFSLRKTRGPKDKKVEQKSFLSFSLIKRSLRTNFLSFSGAKQSEKNKKKEKKIFSFYFDKIKELQNTDKISSFITVFKPFDLTLPNAKLKVKKLKKKKLSLQIQKLIWKKEKEKVIWSNFCPQLKSKGSILKLSNKYKPSSNQIQKKGLFTKLGPKYQLKKEKKNLNFSSVTTLHFIQSFERIEKNWSTAKAPSMQINRPPPFEVLLNQLSQTSSGKKKVEFIVLRPLVKINRETLFLFSKNLKIPIYYDKSNKDLNITRNYIRKVLVPLLKKINPRVEENIYKFSKIIEFYYQLAGDLKCPSERFNIFNP